MKVALRLAVVVGLAAATWSIVQAQDKKTPRLPTLAPPKPALQIRGVPTTAQLSKPVTSETTLPAVTSGPLTPTSSLPLPIAGSPVPSPSAPSPSVPSRTPAPTTAQPTSSLAATDESKASVNLSVGTLSPTPEMWFYEQMRQDYNNAELQVRRNAEQEGAQRRARIAARAWYGVSASRPTAHVTPFTYHYSPAWVASSRAPYRPAVPAAPVVIEHRRPYVGLTGFGSW